MLASTLVAVHKAAFDVHALVAKTRARISTPGIDVYLFGRGVLETTWQIMGTKTQMIKMVVEAHVTLITASRMILCTR